MRTLVLAATALLLSFSAGCNYRVRVGDHDGGSAPRCGADLACDPNDECICGRCISTLPDVVPPACDPPCSTAQAGDLCTLEGRVCSTGPCSQLECVSGSFRSVGGLCADAGWCECPPPPPGCVYDGSPCICDHLTCEGGGERCGRVTCSPGTVCCNATCGTCTPPGAGCAAIVCEPDCSAMEAWGEGACEAIIGVVWNGSSCAEISGCGCSGTDCPHLFESQEACEAVFSACGRSCGGFAGEVCLGTEWCDYPDGWVCGGTDGLGTCRTRPSVCPPVIQPVCGCDGQTYQSPCDAYGAGTDVAADGPCATP